MTRVPAMTPEAVFKNYNPNFQIDPPAEPPVIVWLLLTRLYFEYAYMGFWEMAQKTLVRRSVWSLERMTGDQIKEAGQLESILSALDGNRRFG